MFIKFKYVDIVCRVFCPLDETMHGLHALLCDCIPRLRGTMYSLTYTDDEGDKCKVW